MKRYIIIALFGVLTGMGYANTEVVDIDHCHHYPGRDFDRISEQLEILEAFEMELRIIEENLPIDIREEVEQVKRKKLKTFVEKVEEAREEYDHFVYSFNNFDCTNVQNKFGEAYKWIRDVLVGVIEEYCEIITSTQIESGA